MKDFKVGDRVKYTSGKHGDSFFNPLWGGEYGYIKGTIVRLSDHTIDRYHDAYIYEVAWDNGNGNDYCIGELEHVNIIPEEMFTL